MWTPCIPKEASHKRNSEEKSRLFKNGLQVDKNLRRRVFKYPENKTYSDNMLNLWNEPKSLVFKTIKLSNSKLIDNEKS